MREISFYEKEGAVQTVTDMIGVVGFLASSQLSIFLGVKT